MKWFYGLKIAKKLILSFVVVILLAATVGIFAIAQLAKVNQASTVIASNSLPSVRLLLQMQVSITRFRISELQHILSTEEADFNAADKAMASRMEIFGKQQSSYESLASTPDEAAVYLQVRKTLEAYSVQSKIMLALSREGKKDEARAVYHDASNKLFRSLNDDLEMLIKFYQDGATAADNNAARIYNNARIDVSALLIAAILLGIAAAALITLSLKRQLGGEPADAVAIANSIATGDLGVQINVHPNDRSSLLFSLAMMRDQLTAVVTRIHSGAQTIATASNEIAAGNLDLSSRTEQQAGSLEETASAMEQLTSTVKQNAGNAHQASQFAGSASDIAVEGGKAVARVVDTMNSINQSARKIVDIIGVIDGIAFQTNILALNAAVEAARAGEQGRGFAVVAGEVRGLAQRSAAAAREIKLLIGNSVEKVDAGLFLVEQAGTTINEVVNSVKRVTDIVSEISQASHEQSIGIEEVNRAITQMDKVTQQNAVLVEQATAAVASMQEQAVEQVQAVSVFILKRNAGTKADFA